MRSRISVLRRERQPERANGRRGWWGAAPMAILGAVVALAIYASAPIGATAAVRPAASSCIPSGTDATINAALVGVGAQAVLCPGAVFNLSNSVTFTAANQEIYTQGLPTDTTRATLLNGQRFRCPRRSRATASPGSPSRTSRSTATGQPRLSPTAAR